MSTRVDLRIKTELDWDFLTKGLSLRLVRLIVKTQLKTSVSWTGTYEAIVDTGNPLSIIPASIWGKSLVKLLTSEPIRLYGIGTDEKSAASGNFGEIIIIFSDRRRVSPPIKLKAFLLDDDSTPLLIGFEDVLTVTNLFCDYRSQKAYLEW